MANLEILLEQHARALWMLGLVSVVMLVGTALLIPLIIIFLPADLFIRPKRPWRKSPGHPLVGFVFAIARNLVGSALLIAGAVMLFIPGQGLLTILLALVMMDFPGKMALITRLAQNTRVMRAANRIRRWTGKPAFLSPRTPPSGNC